MSRKINQVNLRRLTLTAKEFSAKEALAKSLISEVYEVDEFEELVIEEINTLLSISPEAQQSYKELQHTLYENNFEQSKNTTIAISEIRASEMGKHGLNCFFEKKPSWIRRLLRINLYSKELIPP